MRVLVDGQTLTTPDLRRGVGRVFLALMAHWVVRDPEKTWFMAVPGKVDLSMIPPKVLERIQVVELPDPMWADGYESASRQWSAEVARVCELEGIHTYWCPNPLMLNVVLPLDLTGVRRVCTMFDVIPARLPENYQARWTQEQRAEYRRRLGALGDWADLLVFISEAARSDFLDLFPEASGVSCSVPIAVDHNLFWASAAIATPPEPGFVMCVGGGDPRKNSERAIEAFGLLAREGTLADELELRIVGDHDPEHREILEKCAAGNDVGDRVVLTGEVSDRELSRLYREASALLFPSLYEGFGLPVLEAQASGLPVVASDRPELRECGGEFVSYCDPLDPVDIAEKLAAVLRDPAEARRRARGGMVRAREFTWERAADRYSVLLDSPTVQAGGGSRRLRIAWVSPWPPDRSGIAAYSREVVAQLKEHVDLEVFVERPRKAVPFDGVPIHDFRSLKQHRHEFDEVVFHLGNSVEFHSSLYREAWESPGVIVLHDFNLHSFLHAAYLGSRDRELYRQALEESHGREGAEEYELVFHEKRQPRIFDFPASRAIAERSRAVIVHSAWVRDRLDDVANVEVVPHGATPRPLLDASERTAARARVGLREEDFVVGAFGFINPHKRIDAVLEACARLRASGHRLTLLLVGAVNGDGFDLDGLMQSFDAASFTRTLGFVDEAAYWQYVDACDVVVNLRYPTMGESSGSLMRAVASGAACIVSDHGPSADLPDAACWKVATDESEVDELEACLGALLREPELRSQLGNSAGQWARAHLDYGRIARRYAEVLRRSAERGRDDP